MSLSEKGERCCDIGGTGLSKVYGEEDVKEFIRALKEIDTIIIPVNADSCPTTIIKGFIKKIDELAGEELT